MAGTLGAERPVFPQMRRPLDLPLQPPACPSSPHHQPPMRSLPQPEERVTENRLADPFLQEKASSHCLDVSPQRPTVDRPPPATDPPPKTHVGNSGSRRGQTWRPCVLWGLSWGTSVSENKSRGPPSPPCIQEHRQWLRLPPLSLCCSLCKDVLQRGRGCFWE